MTKDSFKKELKKIEKVEREVYLAKKYLLENCPHEYKLNAYSIYGNVIELTYYCNICFDLKIEQRNIKDIKEDEKEIHDLLTKDGYKIQKNEIVKIYKFI